MKNTKNTEELFYVQNEGYCGNALFWWAKGRRGYTVDIRNAEKFTRDELKGITRHQDTAWPCEYIDGLEKSHKLIIDCQYIKLSKAVKKPH